MQKISMINEGLYLGNFGDSMNLDNLKKLGITHIVNISGLNNTYPEDFEYLRIYIEDDESKNIAAHFGKSNRFIYNAIAKGGKVLVHCIEGKSRSPAIVVAFLMRKKKMNFSDAYFLVKKERPMIEINQGFLKQLKEYC